jgi:hypothetical protein
MAELSCSLCGLIRYFSYGKAEFFIGSGECFLEVVNIINYLMSDAAG